MKIKRYNQIRREILSAESRLEILNNEVDLDDEEEQEKTEVKQKISKLENIQEQIRGALDIDI